MTLNALRTRTPSSLLEHVSDTVSNSSLSSVLLLLLDLEIALHLPLCLILGEVAEEGVPADGDHTY